MTIISIRTLFPQWIYNIAEASLSEVKNDQYLVQYAYKHVYILAEKLFSMQWHVSPEFAN